MGINLPTRLLAPVALVATFGCAPAPKVQVRAAMPPVAGSPSLEQGLALLRGGNVSMAIETLRIAARQDPNSKRALNALGVAYDRLGRFDLSRSYYEQALAVAPADTDILHNLSISLRMQGRIAEAEQVAQEEQSRRSAATQEHADAIAAPSTAPISASAEILPSQMERAAAASPPSAPLPHAAPSFAVRGASIDVALPPPAIARARITPAALSGASGPRATIPASAMASASATPVVHADTPRPRTTIAAPAIASASITPVVHSAAPRPRATFAAPAMARASAIPVVHADTPRPRTTIAAPAIASASITPPAHSATPRPQATIAVSANVRRSSALGLRVVNCVGRRGMARRIAGAIAARGFGGAELTDATLQRDRTVLILPNAAPARFSEVLRSLNIRPAVVRYRNVKFATLMLGADAVALDRQLVRTRRA